MGLAIAELATLEKRVTPFLEGRRHDQIALSIAIQVASVEFRLDMARDEHTSLLPCVHVACLEGHIGVAGELDTGVAVRRDVAFLIGPFPSLGDLDPAAERVVQKAVFKEWICPECRGDRRHSVVRDLTPCDMPTGIVDTPETVLETVVNAAAHHLGVRLGREADPGALAIENFASLHGGARSIVDLQAIAVDVVHPAACNHGIRLACDVDASQGGTLDGATGEHGLCLVPDFNSDLSALDGDLIQDNKAVRPSQLDRGMALLDSLMAEIGLGATLHAVQNLGNEGRIEDFA